MNLDEKRWVRRNLDTKITWTEEQVYKEYAKKENADDIGTQWCQIMMAGILGSVELAKSKYPEMWI